VSGRWRRPKSVELTGTRPAQLSEKLDTVLIGGGIGCEKVEDSLLFRPCVIEEERLANSTSTIEQCKCWLATLCQGSKRSDFARAINQLGHMMRLT
jgi:hypothetical protein